MKNAFASLDAQTVQFMLFNFLSSTGIIFTNKYLAKHYNFKFSVLLTACHFVITYIGVIVCRGAGMYKAKKLNHMEVLPITLAFVGFVVFNNLSLQENSVGFYQLAKVLTTPVIAILQYVGFGIDMDYRLKLAMIPVIFGVILASVSDVQFNAIGCFWAVAGILSTSYYQIFVKTKQRSLNANSFQVLQYQAPQAAIIVFMLSPFLDGMVSGKNQLKDVDWSNGLIMTFFLSCGLAFCVNLSIFLVVGKTSPISYNVLGHMKLLVILSGSVLIFGEKISVKRFIGMIMAFAGIVYYTHVKIMGNAKKEGWDKKSGKETEMVEEGKSLITKA